MWLAYFLTFYIPFVAIVCYAGRTQMAYYRTGLIARRYSRDYLFVVLAYLPLMIMACFRSEDVGNDNVIYINFFYHVKEELGYSDFSIITRYEPGFVLYNKILGYFFDSPQVLLFTSSFFILFSIMRTIWKYSASVWLSVFLFFCINFNATMVTMRQHIALGILLFAFDFIIKRKLKYFLLLWLLACSFHYTAAVFFAAYFIYKMKVDARVLTRLVLILPIAVFLSFILLNPFLNFFHDEGMYEYYNTNNKFVEGGVKLATLVLIAFNAVTFIFSTKIFRATKKQNVLNQDGLNRTLYLFCMIGFLIVTLSLPFNLLSRVATFFSFFNCILIPNVMNELTRNKKYDSANWLGFFFVVLYGAYYIVINTYRPEWTRIYPYEFCF